MSRIRHMLRIAVAILLGLPIAPALLAQDRSNPGAGDEIGSPAMSLGEHLLSIPVDECMQRARFALTAEGFRGVSQGGTRVFGLKDIHNAVIMCNRAPEGWTRVDIVVSSSAVDDLIPRLERDKLQARIEQAGGSATSRRGTASQSLEPGQLIDSLIVSARERRPVSSIIVLEENRNYVIEARGSFSVWPGRSDGVDAVFCYIPEPCGGELLNWNQLRINGRGMQDIVDGLEFAEDHVYRVPYEGEGQRIPFFILDGDYSPRDNSGGLFVRIYEALE